MSVELHLPDLPEVPLSVGLHAPRESAARARRPWHERLQERLSSSLPLMLMALLAVATWWLAKNAPRAPAASATAPSLAEPDYTMQGFALERFDAQGRLKLRIEGAELRHFPDTDRVEITQARIHAFAPDGRITQARAQRAVGQGDGSELQLLGGAEVVGSDADGAPVYMRSEFLHAFLQLQKLSSNQPVQVKHGGAELRAQGLEYDQRQQRLQLLGQVKAVLPPRAVTNAPLAVSP